MQVGMEDMVEATVNLARDILAVTKVFVHKMLRKTSSSLHVYAYVILLPWVFI